MKVLIVIAVSAALFCGVARGEEVETAERYTLSAIIRYGLEHNPALRMSRKTVEGERYGIDAARAERMGRLDIGGGYTRYRYPSPLTPIVITLPLTAGTSIPEFERNIYDGGVFFRLPLFKGGRLKRGVQVAELKKTVAEDGYTYTAQELVYNLSSLYFKILQLEKTLEASNASVVQLTRHREQVQTFLKAGTVPVLDLLKTDVELSHVKENRLLVRNGIDTAVELLKTLMGMDDMQKRIALQEETMATPVSGSVEEDISSALNRRPDYRAVAGKRKIAEERVKMAQGKRLPDVVAAGDYGGRAGDNMAFKENWNFTIRFALPIFDGGAISTEVQREKVELERVKEEERAIRLAITREVKDAHVSIRNAGERIDVTSRAITSARENLRVELLKYETGTGTSTDVIDAQTALLRAETEQHQAVFDREIARALLRKAIGDEVRPTGGEK